MLNLAFALFPTLASKADRASPGRLATLACWARDRLRYRRALRELERLDGSDLDGLGLGRADFAALAARHAAGLAPLTPSQLVSLRRL